MELHELKLISSFLPYGFLLGLLEDKYLPITSKDVQSINFEKHAINQKVPKEKSDHLVVL